MDEERPQKFQEFVNAWHEHVRGFTVWRGAHGLLYVTDPECPGVFVADADLDKGVQLACTAKILLRQGGDEMTNHVVREHKPSGIMVTVPIPDWQTEAQRGETLTLLQKHVQGDAFATKEELG